MHLTNVYEAKTHLSKLIARSLAGEEVVLGKAGKPVVKLVPYQEVVKRKPGFWKGQVTLKKDFDELPPSILTAFKGR